MPTPGLLARVTKYLPSDLANPGENRLTEVTAAVLERHPALAYEFCFALAAYDPVSPPGLLRRDRTTPRFA